MNNFFPGNFQDTLKVKKTISADTVRLRTDYVVIATNHAQRDSVKHKIFSETGISPTITIDTTSVYTRNSISDVTFYDTANLVTRVVPGAPDRFLLNLAEKSRSKEAEFKANLVQHLREGEKIPEQQFHGDWILLTILSAAFLYSLIRTVSKSHLPEFLRFFLFRGINDPSSRDVGGLFHWQSTLLNLLSFSVISLFITLLFSYYDIIPSSAGGFTIWLISLGVLMAGVTLRHFTCILTGNLSGQREVFREYLLAIFHAYRYGALLLFFIIILLLYTILLPVKIYFIAGIIALGLLYLVRIIRLFIIFINKNISILYLILYLCALEILPVAISIKYFTGLV